MMHVYHFSLVIINSYTLHVTGYNIFIHLPLI